MRATTMSALLLASLLGACAEIGETSDMAAFDRTGSYVAPPTVGYCGDCGYRRVEAWHTERSSSGTRHVDHARRPHHDHHGRHDRDKDRKR